MGYLNFERQSTSIATVGIANGMMVSCNKLRTGFDNVGSVTGTFYPPVASPHDQSLQHYSGTQSSKSAGYSMQSTVESNYTPVQCGNRQQSIGIRGPAESCSGKRSSRLCMRKAQSAAERERQIFLDTLEHSFDEYRLIKADPRTMIRLIHNRDWKVTR